MDIPECKLEFEVSGNMSTTNIILLKTLILGGYAIRMDQGNLRIFRSY